MRILVCNDDGVSAPGIRALAEALRAAGHHVTVSAPDRERSCASHALSMTEPLYAQRVAGWGDIPAFAVSGTPADSCKLGLECLAEGPVDLVVSGINQGGNTGSDTLYSGTVAAAMEAALSGVPALAVSLYSSHGTDFSGAARYAVQVCALMEAGELPPCAVYNLNVPPLPFEQVRGLRAANLSLMRYVGGYERRVSPFGREYYWLRTELDKAGVLPDTDTALVRQGYATLTPLGWALADDRALSALPQFLTQAGRDLDGTV